MSKLAAYFDSWTPGSEPLDQRELLGLETVSLLNQEETISLEELKTILHDKKNPDRKRYRQLNSDRLFRHLMEIADFMNQGVTMSLPYAMMISVCSENTKDVTMLHGWTVYQAMKNDVKFIDVDFWAMKACAGGLWKKNDWNRMWREQREKVVEGKSIDHLEVEQNWIELKAFVQQNQIVQNEIRR